MHTDLATQQRLMAIEQRLAAIETSIQLFAGLADNLRTELLAIKSLLADSKNDDDPNCDPTYANRMLMQDGVIDGNTYDWPRGYR